MKRIISALVLAIAVNLCSADTHPLELAPSAPERYTVSEGDTLWGIAGKYLKEPWRWPEIWRMKKEDLKRPMPIYAGSVILLHKDADGRPYLTIEGQALVLRPTASGGTEKVLPKVYSTPNAPFIPPIPAHIIEPFIAAPLVSETNALETAPRILATQQDRVFLGAGDMAYADHADPTVVQWYLFRNGKPLLDPQNPKRILGYEAFHLGTAKQINNGPPPAFQIQTASQEIGIGDRLVPVVRPSLVDYQPHRPEVEVDGRVVSIYGGIGSAGRGSIISLSLGEEEGIEIGHVLAISRERVVTSRTESGNKETVTIPPQRIGLVFIFRTFKNISYGLVTQSDGTVDVNDNIQTP